MGDSVAVREAGPERLDEFIELLEEAAAWLWGRGIRQWEPGSMRPQRAALQNDLREGCLLLDFAPDQLHGGCVVTLRPTPEWAERGDRAAYLHKLAVARAWAGAGRGRAILSAAERWARSRACPCLRLDCWDGNAALRAFYRDSGFRELDAVSSHGACVRLFERALD